MQDDMLRAEVSFQAIDGLISLAKSAEFKDVDELTEDERLAIAMIAGVDTLSAINENGNMEIRTRWAIGIEKVNGKFNVFEAPRNH